MTPLKLAVNDEDCVELRKIGDRVSDGRLLLFIPCMIQSGTALNKCLFLVTAGIKARRTKMVE